MAKILEFKSKDKTGREKVVGKLEIKNQSQDSAELYFYGDIIGSSWDRWQDEDKCPQDVADFLNGLEGVKNIDIYVNSGGGDVFGGLAIYNILKRNPANKTVHVDGLAASIASVIALAGDKVIIPSTAQFMIHQPWTIALGNANDFRKLADILDKCSQSILNVYKENLREGIDINTIKQMMDDETWMTGDEAAKYFNVEVDETADIAACADSQYYSKYKHLPKNLRKIRDGVVPDNISTEIAPEDTPWAAPILSDFTDKSWDELTDKEKKDIAGHYAWAADMPPEAFGDLKLPHHRAKDGKVVWNGVANAAARLDITDIPEADKAKVRTHLGDHYHQFGKTPPWEQDNSNDKTVLLKAKLALELEL